MAKKVSLENLAAEIGISARQLRNLRKAGCPASSASETRDWRAKNLHPAKTRGAESAYVASLQNAISRVESLADEIDVRDPDQVESLREAFLSLPRRAQGRTRMQVPVWDALTGLAPIAPRS